MAAHASAMWNKEDPAGRKDDNFQYGSYSKS